MVKDTLKYTLFAEDVASTHTIFKTADAEVAVFPTKKSESTTGREKQFRKEEKELEEWPTKKR